MPRCLMNSTIYVYLQRMYDKMWNILIILILMAFSGCSADLVTDASSCAYARYFDVTLLPSENDSPEDSIPALVTISPYDGTTDTLRITESFDNVICMSSSHVAALAAIGADSVITAVSGIRYISNENLVRRFSGEGRPLADIGYESSLDYEKIMELSPDLLVTYTVSAAEPTYIAKLRSLGVPVIILYDHLEFHPLARAEYMRLFGALTDRMKLADSLFCRIASRYEALASSGQGDKRKVLTNIPYADAWYVPGTDGYMSHLVRDAGGEILGSEPGTSSSVITLEEAYVLSQEADIWLNPGHCRSIEELTRVHQLFRSFGPVANSRPIYNNTLRMTSEGGNDFWESGAVRPDLILEDLIRIFDDKQDSLNYFFKLN